MDGSWKGMWGSRDDFLQFLVFLKDKDQENVFVDDNNLEYREKNWCYIRVLE